MTDHERGYEIQSFFCPDSVDTYLGDTPNVLPLISGHSYWTTTPLNMLRDYRLRLRNTLDTYGVDFWQSETCIMGNDEEIGGGHGFDRTMKTALYVARIIHHDIVYAGARSWQWWRAIGGDYKDGLIREYTDPDLQDGRVEDSKLMWILGNYSRFIRPGAVRMSVETTDKEGKAIRDGDTDQQGLMCSAYRNTDGQWAMVVINYADREQEFTVDVNDPKVKSWQGYRTSDVAGEDLLPVGKLKNKKVAVIPARSVTTFVSGNRCVIKL
jgi:O-glycosyl hydrolase